MLAVASDDGRIKLFDARGAGSGGGVAASLPVAELEGHEDAVQAVAFDAANGTLVSAGSDGSVRLWGVVGGGGGGGGASGVGGA